jgi:hypothetical protein
VPESTRKIIEATLQSPRAVTFVDILAILRSVRCSGHPVDHFQDYLLRLLDHPLATARSIQILEKAVTAELKSHEREFLRGRQTLRMNQHRQRVRGVRGQDLRVELPIVFGSYWESRPDPEAFEVTLALGELAKPGHDCFIVHLKDVGRHRASWVRKQDARIPSGSPQRSIETTEFYIELMIENQP